MLSSAQPLQLSTTSGTSSTTVYSSKPQDHLTSRKPENTEAQDPAATIPRSSHLKRREPYERMNPPPIPHRRTQSLQSSFFQQRPLSPPSSITTILTQPTQEIMISRHYLLGNVCFTNFLKGPSNRFTTLMTETLECGYCREAFHTLEDLKKHLVRASHSVWICCHNLYRSKRLRDNHRRDYSCQSSPVPGNCGYAEFYESTGKGEFTISMRTGKCGYCDKETGSSDNLRAHLVDEVTKVMGHEVWYAYGRFFKEGRDMERWKEFCEMGNEDEALWAETEGEGALMGVDNGIGAGYDGRGGMNGGVIVGATTKRRRTISNGSGMNIAGIN
ncbi:hypothetical protein L211DRAFT_844874 [Terfezia boudieri ATCC MYA-4762]|uniref:C2H2-type domain-containing protein n=1 Tax=Terfezia boudieri ATCC MYA-4762 TaxID=1051890 RepID=A0A3N4M7J8_9PEZI|nr:hypothetical protein L211DRAFT_844874 [Terfezia boudieri ATCC MYA-4762]